MVAEAGTSRVTLGVRILALTIGHRRVARITTKAADTNPTAPGIKDAVGMVGRGVVIAEVDCFA